MKVRLNEVEHLVGDGNCQQYHVRLSERRRMRDTLEKRILFF